MPERNTQRLPGEIPRANWRGPLNLPDLIPEVLVFRISSYLRLVNLEFSAKSKYDDENPETRDPLDSYGIEFCQASGQRALEHSLEYAVAHEISVPEDLLFKAKSAVERYRPLADKFYARRR